MNHAHIIEVPIAALVLVDAISRPQNATPSPHVCAVARLGALRGARQSISRVDLGRALADYIVVKTTTSTYLDTESIGVRTVKSDSGCCWSVQPKCS